MNKASELENRIESLEQVEWCLKFIVSAVVIVSVGAFLVYVHWHHSVVDALEGMEFCVNGLLCIVCTFCACGFLSAVFYIAWFDEW